jgi:hypothetical protein
VTNVFDVQSKDVVQAKYIGPAVIGGVECDHVAFRNDYTDWQLWVQKGPHAIPCKLVITTKAVTGAVHVDHQRVEHRRHSSCKRV